MMETMQIPVMMGSDKATQHIVAPVQEDLIAKQAYAVGDLFIFNNGLYKVTTSIASGGAISIGTNCQAASTVVEELRYNTKYLKFFNGRSISFPMGLYASMLFVGTVGGVGGAILSLYTSGESSIQVKDVVTGATYSNNFVSFSYLNGIVTISTTYNSNGMIISGGLAIS